MNLIEKLDSLKHLVDTTDTGDDERRATHETFEFVFALEEAWPKLRAIVMAAKIAEMHLNAYQMRDTGLTDALEALSKDLPTFQ